MNGVFSFFRFSKLLKSQFRLASTPLIVYVLATLTFYFLTVWLIKMPGTRIWQPFWGVTCVTGTAGVLIMSSLFCANVRKKIGFQTFNLLPVSNLEKYLARVLIYNVLPLIIWGVLSFALYLNDDFVSKLGFEKRNLPVHIILAMLLVWLSSLAAFWGTMFRRFGFVVFLVFTTLLIVLTVNWLINANLMFLDPVARFIGKDLHRLYLVVGLFTGSLTIVNLTAAYFVYRRKEMRSKLFNW